MNMKKTLLLSLLIGSVLYVTACADGKPTVARTTDLPAQAQTFLKKHFSTLAVNQVTVESRFIGRKYEVMLAGGGEIEFDRNGNWTKVDCRLNAVPESAVPGKILQYVKLHYPDYFVSVIEKEDGGYEVEMRDVNFGHDIDLVFNGRQEFVRID